MIKIIFASAALITAAIPAVSQGTDRAAEIMQFAGLYGFASMGKHVCKEYNININIIENSDQRSTFSKNEYLLAMVASTGFMKGFEESIQKNGRNSFCKEVWDTLSTNNKDSAIISKR